MPAHDSRWLDRILHTLRASMRTRGLPRPDRLVISTGSRSVHAEFTRGTGPDRVAALLLWTATLHGVCLTLSHRHGGRLHLAVAGRTGAGISIGLACAVTVTELGGHLIELEAPSADPVLLAVFAHLPHLREGETDPVSYDELVRVVTTARTGPARSVGVVA